VSQATWATELSVKPIARKTNAKVEKRLMSILNTFKERFAEKEGAQSNSLFSPVIF